MYLGVSKHGVYPRNGRLNRKDDDEPVDLGMPYFQTNWNLWYTYQSLPQMGSQILAHKNHRCWVRFCAANHPIWWLQILDMR